MLKLYRNTLYNIPILKFLEWANKENERNNSKSKKGNSIWRKI